ncbi:MAG: ATP-binding protein [Promethearchaeota archaeon]
MPESFLDSLLINISIVFLVSSTILVIYSFNFEERYVLKLDCPARKKSKGTINIGKITHENKSKYNFYLKIEDLEQHMFVCGATGTGKSNFLQNFLLHFVKKHDIPFLITEFKGEYQFLQEKIKDLVILKPGENFSINIFDPENSNPEVHAERVFQIFESGGLLEGIEYSPQMERTFVDILNKVCPVPENRNWERFFELSEKYYKATKDITFLKSVVAVQNRIRRYGLGTLKDIFVKKSGINAKDLFEHNVLLDLSSIIRLGGEKEDALFFLNMILKYLWDKNIEFGSKNYKSIKHITIIEDAQYFAPEELSSRTKLTSYIEDIALLLRGTGECLISLATRPKISKEILANCGVLVSFQNHMQKDLMQELLNLKDWQKEYLSMLKKGECIVRVNSIEKPFILQTEYVERSWLSDDEIMENNQKIIESKINTLENKITKELEVIESNINKKFCKFCYEEIKDNSEYCEICSQAIEEAEHEERERKQFKELKLLVNELYEKQSKK